MITPCSRRTSWSTWAGVGSASAPLDQHGLAGQQRFAEDLQAGVAQRGAGGHDVGDRVGDVKPHGGLDRAVEADDLGRDAMRGEVGRARRPGYAVAMRLPARSATEAAAAGRPAKRNVEPPKPELQDRFGRGAGVQQQVLAGDADVEAAGADVDGDVARAQEEELGVVLGVEQDEFTAVACAGGSRPRSASGSAGSASEPLFGTAMRSMGLPVCEVEVGGGRAGLQMSVDVVEPDALAEHDDLDPVEQLADLLGGALGRFVLGGHPDLGGLLDDLLALGVHAGVERLDGRRTGRARAAGGR